MNPTDIANALLFGIPFVSYAGLQHGFESLKAYTTFLSHDDRAAGGHADGADSPSGHEAWLRVAVATSARQIHAAQSLVRNRYAWRGYDFDDDDRTVDWHARAHNDITLVVETARKLVGTATLGIDGPHG